MAWRELSTAGGHGRRLSRNVRFVALENCEADEGDHGRCMARGKHFKPDSSHRFGVLALGSWADLRQQRAGSEVFHRRLRWTGPLFPFRGSHLWRQFVAGGLVKSR